MTKDEEGQEEEEEEFISCGRWRGKRNLLWHGGCEGAVWAAARHGDA
jgi:hypothetical protein